MAKSAPTTPSAREIIASVKKGNYAPVYLLMGEEPWYLDQITSWLEKSVVAEEDKDFDFEVFYGADTDVETVSGAARQYPMMARKRLVILKEAQAMTNYANQLAKLEGYANHMLETTVLVIVVKGKELPATSKFVKSVKANGGVDFSSPKIREYQMAVPIREYCNDHKIGIDPDAIDLLVSFLGNSLNKVFGEIDKLVVASGKEFTRISRQQVMANIGMNKEFNPFELVKAVGMKDYGKAMAIVKYFASNPRQNPVVTLIGSLFKFFSQISVAYYTPDKSDQSLMGVFGMHSAWQLKDIKEGMRMYNASQAIKAISFIRELDCKSKGIDSMQNEHELLKECIFKIITAR